MPNDPVIRCEAVRKEFRVHQRAPGLRGILQSFVRRRYRSVVALDGVGLAIDEGELVGLIGENGAGKTTLVKCLTGIVPASSGTAELFGRDAFHLANRHKERLSLVMGQRSQLWWDLAPLDSFELLREIYSVDRADFRRRLDEYAERLDVAAQLTVQLRRLSLGQRMKMAIIGAFLPAPDVLFLDEPTIGLDLIARDAIREFLVEINRERGATIVLTSHDMEDIEETCERLLILDAGRLIFDGDLVELRHRLLSARAIEVHLQPHGRGWSPELGPELEPFGAELVKHGALALTFVLPAERTQPFLRRLLELVDVRDLTIERQPLEHLIREVYGGRTLEAAAPGAP